MARDADPAELVIDALQAVGKSRVTEVVIAKLREFVHTHNLRKKLLLHSKRAPAWVLSIIDSIVTEARDADG